MGIFLGAVLLVLAGRLAWGQMPLLMERRAMMVQKGGTVGFTQGDGAPLLQGDNAVLTQGP